MSLPKETIDNNNLETTTGLSKRSSFRAEFLLLAITLFTFFFLLGGRSLNETDEGRYAEIGREMLESNNWLVPHFWYAPHLDKPPVIYWAVASSMRCFGPSEWAIRFPLALAGMSGVVAAYFLGLSLGGRKVAFWSSLILQSSVLYFLMARVVTPDIFLSQFIAWSALCFWQGWRALDKMESSQARWKSTLWFCAGWAVCGLGFLTKGPIAVAVPMVGLVSLVIYRWKDKPRRNALLARIPVGLPLFAVIALPWYLMVFKTVPKSLDYMVFGQVFGHLLGTAVKNRSANPFFFFGILAFGFLPWTWLLGWLWRKKQWQSLSPLQREGWIFLGSWAIFTFCLFTFSKAKLPAYILPMFLPLAVLTATRFFGSSRPELPLWLGRLSLLSPAVLIVAAPIAIFFVCQTKDLPWQMPQLLGGLALAAILFYLSRKWSVFQCLRGAVALVFLNFVLLGFAFPTVETDLKGTQTLKPLGEALKKEYHPGDIIVCWGGFPQGLPFYSYPLISSTNIPYLGGTSLNRVPFEFPGNLERFGSRVLTDYAAFDTLLKGKTPVLVAATQGTYNLMKIRLPQQRLRFITTVGRWELFEN